MIPEAKNTNTSPSKLIFNLANSTMLLLQVAQKNLGADLVR